MNRIQNFLLHPKHNSQVDGKQVYDKDGSCNIKGRKLVKQIEIEGNNFQSSARNITHFETLYWKILQKKANILQLGMSEL